MKNNNNKALFAAGCFWGVQKKFDELDGVIETTVGYTGGKIENPTYKQVCSDKTGHAEAILVKFDDEKISYEELVRFFFKIHDPTQKDRQGPDIGSQYRSAIFFYDQNQKEIAEKVLNELNKEKYNSKIVTEVVKSGEFYKAEDYHQKYLDKKGGVCY